MLCLETPPRPIESRVFSAMPESFRRRGMAMEWADANRPGQPTDGFIEDLSFKAGGNRYVVDIPFGRILGIAPDGAWSLVVEDEGCPNGLKIGADGIFVADCRHGLVELEALSAWMPPVKTSRHSESFRGCNDLHIASNGDIYSTYFTDQGQTGPHDPTGRVCRLAAGERLDRLIDTVISPNRRALDPMEATLFVAMTRDNAVWKDGSVSQVGRLCPMFEASGPDGPTRDVLGRLFGAHASLGQLLVFAPNGELIARIKSCTGPTCTNVATGAGGDRLDITESTGGSVLVVDRGALNQS